MLQDLSGLNNQFKQETVSEMVSKFQDIMRKIRSALISLSDKSNLEPLLQELRRKRLEQQVLYLKSELEETQWIFQNCLREFDVEFRKYNLP